MVTVTEVLELGVQHQRAGRLDVAETIYRRVLEFDPGQADALNLLATVMVARQRPGDARALAAQALARDAGNAAYQANLAHALLLQGDVEAAGDGFRRALGLAPDEPRVLNNLGTACQRSGRPGEAARWYRRSLAALPGEGETLANLGAALEEAGALDDALAAFAGAIAGAPDQALAQFNRAVLLQKIGDVAGAAAGYRRALAIRPDFVEAHSNLLVALVYDPEADDVRRYAEARRWEALHAANGPLTVHPRAHDGAAADPERRLRVGYLSADLREHPVVYNLGGLFEHRDRASFEITAYAAVPRPDPTTRRLMPLFDRWRDVANLDDAAVAERIRADAIDILVVLAGHTGGNRLRVAAARPAPVQVSLGDVTTSGLDAIDYWLTDPFLHPVDDSERYAEELISLPSFEAHRRPAEAPEPGPPPSLAQGHVTFGSFNNPAKLTETTIACWAAVLERVPGARLRLKYVDWFTRPAVVRRVAGLFARHGIAADRLDLRGGGEARAAHLAQLNEIDIALDPFPFNGCTTSFEALWMGVPVVTLRGDRAMGRVGAGLLGRIGLDDLIAPMVGDYARIAADLAADSTRRAVLRRELRARLDRSILCDAPAHCRSVEVAYRQMWRRWCATGAA
jgi:predicted O-linked N-acetylglucosamine transferase (SPINDLY family)